LFTAEVPDSTLCDCNATREILIRVIRQFRPTLLLGHAPEDYHTDHRAASALIEACSWLCASSGQTGGGPALDAPPELWWMDTVGMQQFNPSLYVDISRFAAFKEQMLDCHASQLRRAGDTDFASLGHLMRNQYVTRGLQSGVAAAEAFRPHHSFKRTRAW
jgi:LmbE family N-acetylglucosaminyl deacetylase